MKLGEAADLGLVLEARCRSPKCGACTPLHPVFFVRRFGRDFTLEALSRRLLCMACGSDAPQVIAHADDEAAWAVKRNGVSATPAQPTPPVLKTHAKKLESNPST